ncbi:hypothetical protein BCU93_13530 [Vibrio breoganii]|uniref:hypothetical protein n=1 Tax=Vibrio breoganii TaxID=553239 RepID=UPI000C818EE7|nr:hypothetical protein [Vibrio breoganii]PMG38563.1 hypothetical protein BCU93_13530 [Vibrio breoganii]
MSKHERDRDIFIFILVIVGLAVAVTKGNHMHEEAQVEVPAKWVTLYDERHDKVTYVAKYNYCEYEAETIGKGRAGITAMGDHKHIARDAYFDYDLLTGKHEAHLKYTDDKLREHDLTFTPSEHKYTYEGNLYSAMRHSLPNYSIKATVNEGLATVKINLPNDPSALDVYAQCVEKLKHS